MATTFFEPFYPRLEEFSIWPRSFFLQAFSTRTEPYDQWNRLPYAFVTEDFCHEKPFTAKISVKSNRSALKIKEVVSQKNGVSQLDDEVKLWFDLPSRGSLYTKVKSNDYIKVQYDHGLRSYREKLFYVFGGFNSTKLLQNVNLRIGLGHVSQNLSTQNRLKVTLQNQKTSEKQGHQYHWYHKTFVAHKEARFGFMAVVDLNKFVFQKNNLLFGWHFKESTSAYIRAEVKNFRAHNPDLKKPTTIFDNLIADVIHRINSKSKVALEATFNIGQKKLEEAKAVYQFEYEPKKIIKTSITNKLGLAIAAKTPLYGLEDIATLSAGVSVEGVATDKPSFKTGFELNVNL